MLKAGLTGGLATGKTYVAGLLGKLGCYVIHADRLGHEVLLPGAEAYDDVVAEFGSGIVAADGTIDRQALGSVVFSNPGRLEALNALVHPHVFRRQNEFFDAVARKDAQAIVVSEAAIMIETGSYKRYDRLILTVCPPEVQIRRFVEREGARDEEARERLARQMSLDDKKKFADYIIDTSGTKADTEQQARQVYLQLTKETR